MRLPRVSGASNRTDKQQTVALDRQFPLSPRSLSLRATETAKRNASEMTIFAIICKIYRPIEFLVWHKARYD